MSHRIKLLLLAPHLGGGGAERVTAQLARWLDPSCFEIHLALCTPDHPGAHSEKLPRYVTLHRIQAPRVRRAAFAILRLVWQLRPHAILSNMAHLNFLILTLKPVLPADSCILVRQNTTASAAARNRLTRLAYRHLYPRANLILCQAEAMAGDLTQHFKIPEDKLDILPNPIDIVEIRTTASAPKSSPAWATGRWPRLLAVGRLSHEKGHDLLLRALPSILTSYPHTQLAILGPGPEEESLRKLSRELEVSHALDLPGHVDYPAAWFAEATLFIQPSRLEGLPNALLEAAAAGLPIASTPSSLGIATLIRNAPGAWLSEDISAESLAQTILTALEALSLPNTNPRFEHHFLAPFEAASAAATCAALIERVVTRHDPPVRK